MLLLFGNQLIAAGKLIALNEIRTIKCTIVPQEHQWGDVIYNYNYFGQTPCTVGYRDYSLCFDPLHVWMPLS